MSDDDRPSSVLTRSQRTYVLGDHDEDETGYERQARQRIRNRLAQAIADLALIAKSRRHNFGALKPGDISQVAKEADEDELEEAVNFLQELYYTEASEPEMTTEESIEHLEERIDQMESKIDTIHRVFNEEIIKPD